MSKEEFSLVELNKPDDWNNLSNMAKKHLPIITAPEAVKADEEFTVKIKVGGIDEVNHPNTLSHWISWVELFAGERPIAKIEFYPELSNGYEAELKVSLKESTELVAKSFCNLHGTWEGKKKKIEIK